MLVYNTVEVENGGEVGFEPLREHSDGLGEATTKKETTTRKDTTVTGRSENEINAIGAWK